MMDHDQLRELRHTAERALEPMRQWHHQCHAATCALVSSGVIKGLRVARGTCMNVGGQHSWAVMGDPYDKEALILDPSLWSYMSISPEVYVGTYKKWKHRPHGDRSIFEWGKPPEATGKVIVLQPPKGGWSEEAAEFLSMLGHLDLEGWRLLAHAPVRGWPAKEILGAMHKRPDIGGYIPIDIVGMLLDAAGRDIFPRS